MVAAGTARDICSVAGLKVPILGIPSVVKKYSGVAAVSSMGALFHASVSYNIRYLILKKYVCNKKNNAFACAGLRVRFSKYLFRLIP